MAIKYGADGIFLSSSYKKIGNIIYKMMSLNDKKKEDNTLFDHLNELGYCLECEANKSYNFTQYLKDFKNNYSHLVFYNTLIENEN